MVITSYALLRRDEELLAKLPLRYAILDEAQNIKNPLSATARAAKRLRADRRLALSGTPIENRLSEIWSIFDFVSPGLLGPLEKFEERYSRPIEAGDQEGRRAPPRDDPPVHPPPHEERSRQGSSGEDRDRSILRAHRRAGGALSRGPQGGARAGLGGGRAARVSRAAQLQILAGLTRLRQAACDPRLLGLPRRVHRRGLREADGAARAGADVHRGRASGARLQSVRVHAHASSGTPSTRIGVKPTSTSTARRRTGRHASRSFQLPTTVRRCSSSR